MSMIEEVPSEKQNKLNIKSGCNSEGLRCFRIYEKRENYVCMVLQ